MSKIDEWNDRWEGRKDQEQDPNPLLIKVVRMRPSGDALDLACGIGRNALYLAKNGWNVEAIDGSEVAIGILQNRAKKLGLNIHSRIVDLETGHFEIAADTFDLICILFYLQRDVLAAARQSLRQGGVLIAAIHMKDESPKVEPMNPAYLMEPGELKKEFAGWKIEHYLEGKSTDTNHERATAEIIAVKG